MGAISRWIIFRPSEDSICPSIQLWCFPAHCGCKYTFIHYFMGRSEHSTQYQEASWALQVELLLPSFETRRLQKKAFLTPFILFESYFSVQTSILCMTRQGPLDGLWGETRYCVENSNRSSSLLSAGQHLRPPTFVMTLSLNSASQHASCASCYPNFYLYNMY